MNPDLESDRKNGLSMISMWQAEEERLRAILEDTQTSSSIKLQVSEKLVSVLDQLQSLTDELNTMDQTN